MPPENDTVHCSDTFESCYFMIPTARSFKDATARCAKIRNGFLVSYNTGAWVATCSCNMHSL